MGIFLGGSVWGFLIFPFLLKQTVSSQSALKPGSKTREEMYLNIPFDIDFKVYFFNITNPEGVMKGEKPNVQDIGPYVFV